MGDCPIEDFESLILPDRNQFYAIFSENLPLAQKDKITPTDLTVANSNLAYTTSLLAGKGHSVQISYNNLYDKKLEGLTTRPLSPKVTDPNIVIWKKNRKLSNLGNLFLEKLRDSLSN